MGKSNAFEGNAPVRLVVQGSLWHFTKTGSTVESAILLVSDLLYTTDCRHVGEG